MKDTAYLSSGIGGTLRAMLRLIPRRWIVPLWRAVIPLVLAGTVLLSSTRAAAGPGRASSLSFVRLPGSEACIGARELAGAVESRLGRAVFVSAARADLVVEGRIQRRSARRWQAAFSVARADGEIVGTRELEMEAESCRALDETLAVIVALLIDPDAPPAAPSQPHQRSAVTAKRPATEPRASAPPRPPPAEFSLGPIALAGALPEIAAGARISAAARHRGWSVELAGAVTNTVETDGRTRGVELRSGHAELLGCPTLTESRALRVDACGGVQLVRLWGRGRALDASYEVSKYYSSVSAVVRLRYSLGPVFAQVAGGPWVPTARPEFRYAEIDTTTLRLERRSVFRVAPVGMSTHLSVVVQFP